MKPATADSGTRPAGASDEKEASQWVERMFAGIAPRYDLLNHLLSFNIDRSWRRSLLRTLQDILQTDEAVVLDLCCGTGDVYLDLRRVARAKVLGADFCFPMLVAAKEKAAARSFAPLLVDADALTLPFADESVHGISIAFGFRNLVNYQAGLVEFLRILKPGGRLVILEFSHPPGLFMKTAYGFYSRVLLPVIGGLVSGSGEAYTYLPSSIRKFPGASALAELVRSVGFTCVEVQLLTGGVAALHVGTKEPRASLLAQ